MRLEAWGFHANSCHNKSLCNATEKWLTVSVDCQGEDCRNVTESCEMNENLDLDYEHALWTQWKQC